MKNASITDAFEQQITGLLNANTGLTYDDGTSESSGEKIKPIRIAWHRLKSESWKKEADGKAEERLAAWASNHSNLESSTAAVEMQQLLMAHDLVSFRRNTNNDEKIDLYILAWFGYDYVGIHTTLIETS